ncbi:hypothetical protein DFJ58DRAFT_846613 [Suillus subalutaceus]|uniref:uncharacterized protein n=1 Tax=Suillus subalutaceus TaxID=48586 RepID=UPI001B874653|nr:uncharacterized protein DFJ58DRAFT_846613 [Suillus subalutaceus]KAG1837180.1 hypothetical protein DFJ58DRAFT_846613 [Suillus subalutaceus]
MPCSTKQLKVYANQVAEEVGVPNTSLHEFVDCGGIYQMLIRIVALVLKNDGKERLKLLANLKELLTSKDFKSALQNCLTACMLLPNITAYVTDTHVEILVGSSIVNNTSLAVISVVYKGDKYFVEEHGYRENAAPLL